MFVARMRAWVTAGFLLAAGMPCGAQTSVPIKEPLEETFPVEVNFFHDVLQTIPVSPTVPGLPALPSGITSTARCLVGSPNGVAPGSFVPIRFVGNVLCIDPGPRGDFTSPDGPGFLCDEINCPGPAVPVLQGVKLLKVEPTIPKCPDVYPGSEFVQTGLPGAGGVVPGIRTWFPLKHTAPGTEFILSLEVTLVRPPEPGRRQVPSLTGAVQIRNFHFRVTVTPDTLAWVVHALHNQPLGVCEVPCITDEGLFDLLLRQADAIRTAAAGGAATVRALNTALDVMEATIVARCLFTLAAWQQRADGRIVPCALFAGELPGNFTIARYTFGIVDTIEHPCCCKLIADLFYLKQSLIGSDP